MLGLMAGAAWGTTSLGSRYLAHVRGIFPPITVFWRFGLAVPLLILAYYLWGRNGKRLEWRDVPKIIGLGALGIFLMANFNFYATVYTTNINSTMIVTASAVLIALIVYFMGAKVTFGQWLGIVTGLAGVGLIALAKSPTEKDLTVWQHLLGIALATGASLSWALYTVLGGGMVEKYGGLRVTVWAITAGALMQVPVAVGSGVWQVSSGLAASDWWVMVYLAIFPTALAFSVWFIALRYVDVTTLGMTQYVGPVISAALGWLWLGERILWQHVAGAALIFIGLRFASIGKGVGKENEETAKT